jgi:uncharacterized protein YbjT (DUF2867 family)
MTPDALICALGTTMAKARSQASFREVGYLLPLRFATTAKSSGADAFALLTAIGAAADSRFFYTRTKGELERYVQAALIDAVVDEPSGCHFRFRESLL